MCRVTGPPLMWPIPLSRGLRVTSRTLVSMRTFAPLAISDLWTSSPAKGSARASSRSPTSMSVRLLDAEAEEPGRRLAGHDAAAQDRHSARDLLQVRHVAGGPRQRLSQAGNVRDRRGGARGDDDRATRRDVASGPVGVGHLDRAGPGQPPVAA